MPTILVSKRDPDVIALAPDYTSRRVSIARRQRTG